MVVVVMIVNNLTCYYPVIVNVLRAVQLDSLTNLVLIYVLTNNVMMLLVSNVLVWLLKYALHVVWI
jgi:hypothetical protein